MDGQRNRARPAGGVAVSCLVGCLLAGCATNPVTGEREFTLMSESQEIAIGQELDVQVRQEMGVYEDPDVQQYVENIGLALARASQRPDLPWHFTVVDVAAINAFALPGGYIYITRGLLSHLGDEAELAGVLGHEIGHVTARHAVQAYTRAAGSQLGLIVGGIFVPEVQAVGRLAETGLGLLFLKYGRDAELQADRLGAEYAAQLDWDPQGVPDLLTTLARIAEATDRQGIPNWLSTHPQAEDRVERIRETVALLTSQADGPFVVAQREYLDRIDGIVFGDNPEEGIVRGNEFIHPDLRFALRFPEGWEVRNSPTQVLARQPGEDTFVILELVEQPGNGDLREVAARSMRDADLRRVDGRHTTINGLEAYLGTYSGRMRDLGDVTALAAHIRSGRNVFLVVGLTGQERYERAAPAFDTALRSFRELSPTEASNVEPNRVELYTARDGDSWQSIAQRAGQGVVPASTLAIMNGFSPNEQPRTGDRLKIVVSGDQSDPPSP